MRTNLSPIASPIRTVILRFAVTCFLTVLASAQGQTLTNALPLPPGFATRTVYLKSLTKEKKILDAYHAGQISKDEAALALSALGNGKSMDTYGKVVDQDGQPVVGAKVRASLEREASLFDDKEYDTKTDAKGLFHFLGLHGSALDIIPEKAGYDFDPKLPCSSRPELYMPDPTNPLIVTMWKLRGAEPMKHIQIDSQVPRDGSVKRFDLFSDRQTNSGDLAVKLIRNPLIIDPRDLRKPFNWSVTFEITNGGLQSITNIYPNEAPLEGYLPTITLDFPTNIVGWQSFSKRAYYFKSQGGQVYGRMSIEVLPSGQTELAPFRAEIFANPDGSRNLEFNPSKQIW